VVCQRKTILKSLRGGHIKLVGEKWRRKQSRGDGDRRHAFLWEFSKKNSGKGKNCVQKDSQQELGDLQNFAPPGFFDKVQPEGRYTWAAKKGSESIQKGDSDEQKVI